MRIISGKFKRYKTVYPYRQRKQDLLKILLKSQFLTHCFILKKFPFKFKNAKILDLYSGTGSFGLECLSREANKVTFVENNKNALKILQKIFTNLILKKRHL